MITPPPSPLARSSSASPRCTCPKNRNSSRRAVLSYCALTDLIFGWSGATPSRTRPHGVASRSNMSTRTSSSASSNAAAA